MRESRVLGDDHKKRLARVTVGLARCRTLLLNGHECGVLVKICSLSPAMGTRLHMSEIYSRVGPGRKTTYHRDQEI